MNYSKQTDRLDLHIDDSSKTILIRQRWAYEWKYIAGATPWTHAEKIFFQQQALMLITAIWESAPKVNVKGSSTFAKQNSKSGFQFRFDIQQSLISPLLAVPHWAVHVYKIPQNHFSKSKVNWMNRLVILDMSDIIAIPKSVKGLNTFQYPIAHEFGHMIGNVTGIFPGSHGDEYRISPVNDGLSGNNRNVAYYADKDSIMNIGFSLRERHYDYLLRELNIIIPNTSFYFNSLALWR
jgi:hypothetical protein